MDDASHANKDDRLGRIFRILGDLHPPSQPSEPFGKDDVSEPAVSFVGQETEAIHFALVVA